MSIIFTEDGSESAALISSPARVAGREGHLDINTTGELEVVWSNVDGIEPRTLTYRLELVPKIGEHSAADTSLSTASSRTTRSRPCKTFIPRIRSTKSPLLSC